jgi:hypothetical protein
MRPPSPFPANSRSRSLEMLPGDRRPRSTDRRGWCCRALALLGVHPQSEGAPLAELGHIGDAEHGFSVGRPVDAVAGEVPAIGRLAHAFENLLKVERACRALCARRRRTARSQARWRVHSLTAPFPLAPFGALLVGANHGQQGLRKPPPETLSLGRDRARMTAKARLQTPFSPLG